MRYLRLFTASLLFAALCGCNMQTTEFASNSDSSFSDQICNPQNSLASILVSADCG